MATVYATVVPAVLSAQLATQCAAYEATLIRPYMPAVLAANQPDHTAD